MKLTLTKKIEDSPDIISFIFKPDQILNFKPGQFLRYHIPNSSPDARGENRFFSIAAAPFEGVVNLTTKFAPEEGSSFKKGLHNLKVGNTIEAFGPSGSFTVEVAEKHYVFIAGGIGITPFRSILLDLDHQNKPLNITLLYANRTQDPIFKDELETLAKKHSEFKIYYFVSGEPIQKRQLSENIKIIPGKIDEVVLKSLILNHQSLIYYVSGPEPMVLSFMEMLTNMKITKENIKRDEFPGYENY